MEEEDVCQTGCDDDDDDDDIPRLLVVVVPIIIIAHRRRRRRRRPSLPHRSSSPVIIAMCNRSSGSDIDIPIAESRPVANGDEFHARWIIPPPTEYGYDYVDDL